MKIIARLFILLVCIPAISHAQNGTVDSSFGINGRTVTTFSVAPDIANAILVQSDGKLLVAGYAFYPYFTNTGYRFAIARYNTNGTPDSTFASNGTTTYPIYDGQGFCTCMALQPDGRILLGGYIQGMYNEDFVLVRLLPNGIPDFEFGMGGDVSMDFGNGNDRVAALCLRPNGKITAVGTSSPGGVVHQFTLLQYQPNGKIDSTFGYNGKVATDFGEQYLAYATAGQLQPDGKLVVSGYAYDAQFQGNTTAARYNEDGSLDSSFGNFGKVVFNIGMSSGSAASAIQPDGKIILAGTAGDNIFMLRLNSIGQPDSSFGIDGKLLNKPGYSVQTNAITFRQNGKINIAGSALVPPLSESHRQAAIVQYNNNGSLDSSFAANGISLSEWGNEYNEAYGIASQPDGKIVIAGKGEALTRFVVARFNNTDIFKTANWTGNHDSNWHNPQNWSTGMVPDYYTTVIIDTASPCIVSQPAACHSLHLSPGANLLVTSLLDVLKQ